MELWKMVLENEEDKLDFNLYQQLAQRTANTKTKEEKLVNGILGLAGESGECADIVKKNMYQGHELNVDDIKDELSDVLWYIAETATAIGVTMEDIARHNIGKLYKRYPKGFEIERSLNRGE